MFQNLVSEKKFTYLQQKMDYLWYIAVIAAMLFGFLVNEVIRKINA